MAETTTESLTGSHLKPKMLSHGTYSFYIIDFDGNWWEILTNPDGGYSYVFDLEDESRSWRALDRGKDRIKGWQEGKSDS